MYSATAGTGFDFYKSGVFNDAKCSSDPKKADLAIVGNSLISKCDFFKIIQ